MMNNDRRRVVGATASIVFFFSSLNCHANESSLLVKKLDAGKPQTIVAYGTSLTSAGAWVSQLSTELERRYPSLPIVINSGGSGMCSAWGVDNLEKRVIDKHPDAVFIEFSMNDAHTKFKIGLPQARSNLLNMVDRILVSNKDCEIILVVMNPPVGTGLMVRPNIEAYNKVVRDVSVERCLMLIDHYPDWQEILKNDPTQFATLIPDGIHPNAEGCKKVILPNILRSLFYRADPEVSH